MLKRVHDDGKVVLCKGGSVRWSFSGNGLLLLIHDAICSKHRRYVSTRTESYRTGACNRNFSTVGTRDLFPRRDNTRVHLSRESTVFIEERSFKWMAGNHVCQRDY